MSEPQSELDIFNKISTDKIVELGDFFDDSILYEPPNFSKLKQILGDDFQENDISKLIGVFYNFFIGKKNPDKIFKIINTSKLDKDKKELLNKIVQQIHHKTDLDKVSISMTYDFLQIFGYARIDTLQNISTEDVSDEYIKNKNAFYDFIKTNLNDPKFNNKFVAFVDGKLWDVGNKRNALIDKVYDEFGNVDMYVDKVTEQKKIILVDTPEFN